VTGEELPMKTGWIYYSIY